MALELDPNGLANISLLNLTHLLTQFLAELDDFSPFTVSTLQRQAAFTRWQTVDNNTRKRQRKGKGIELCHPSPSPKSINWISHCSFPREELMNKKKETRNED